MLAQQTTKSRIVLVEDDGVLQHHVALALQRSFQDYDVRLTQDPAEALDWLADEHSHLLITDAQTRHVDGLAVATSAQSRRPGLPVIVLSDPPCNRERTSQLLATAWIEKPPKLERLIGLVKRVLSERKGWMGEIAISGLPDLVQLLCMATTSGALQVQSGALRGSLWFERGAVVDAKLGALRGVEGFHALMRLPTGTFSLQRDVKPSQRTIELSATQLLLEAMCRIDQERAGLPPDRTPNPNQAAPHKRSVSHIRLASQASNQNAERADPTPAATDRWSTPAQRAAECFERGLEQVRNKNYAQALAEWERANELDPDNHTYQVNLRRVRDLHQRSQTERGTNGDQK